MVVSVNTQIHPECPGIHGNTLGMIPIPLWLSYDLGHAHYQT